MLAPQPKWLSNGKHSVREPSSNIMIGENSDGVDNQNWIDNNATSYHGLGWILRPLVDPVNHNSNQ